MFKVAIVEDEQKWADEFEGFVRRYGAESKQPVASERFSDGMDFISDYRGGFDLILMDIAMPHMNGLEAARRLREKDENVCLIFVTTLAQCAIKGYEVSAFDFLVKPVSYDLFRIKLDKVRAYLGRRKGSTFAVHGAGFMRMVPMADIKYVESVKHYLYIHTVEEELKMRGSLADVKSSFIENNFAEVNRSLLVNLAYVDSTTKPGMRTPFSARATQPPRQVYGPPRTTGITTKKLYSPSVTASRTPRSARRLTAWYGILPQRLQP